MYLSNEQPSFSFINFLLHLLFFRSAVQLSWVYLDCCPGLQPLFPGLHVFLFPSLHAVLLDANYLSLCWLKMFFFFSLTPHLTDNSKEKIISNQNFEGISLLPSKDNKWLAINKLKSNGLNMPMPILVSPYMNLLKILRKNIDHMVTRFWFKEGLAT